MTPQYPDKLRDKIDVFTRLAMDNLEICGPNSEGYKAALVLLGTAVEQWRRGRVLIKPPTRLQQEAVEELHRMRKAG